MRNDCQDQAEQDRNAARQGKVGGHMTKERADWFVKQYIDFISPGFSDGAALRRAFSWPFSEQLASFFANESDRTKEVCAKAACEGCRNGWPWPWISKGDPRP
jgi:hypothetical protein